VRITIDRMACKVPIDAGVEPVIPEAPEGFQHYEGGEMFDIATIRNFMVVHYVRCRPYRSCWTRLKLTTKLLMRHLTAEQIKRRKQPLNSNYSLNCSLGQQPGLF